MVGVKRLVARRLPSHRYSMMGIRHCCSAVSDHYIRPTMIKLNRAVASWSVAWARCRDLRRLFRGTSVTLFNACLVLACYWKIFGYRIRTLLGELHPCGGFVGEAADLSHIRELIRFFSARSWTRGQTSDFPKVCPMAPSELTTIPRVTRNPRSIRRSAGGDRRLPAEDSHGSGRQRRQLLESRGEEEG